MFRFSPSSSFHRFIKVSQASHDEKKNRLEAKLPSRNAENILFKFLHVKYLLSECSKALNAMFYSNHHYKMNHSAVESPRS